MAWRLDINIHQNKERSLAENVWFDCRRYDQRLPQLPPRNRAALHQAINHRQPRASRAIEGTHLIALHHTKAAVRPTVLKGLHLDPSFEHHLPLIETPDAETVLQPSAAAGIVYGARRLVFAFDVEALEAFLDQREQERRAERRVEARQVGRVALSRLRLRLGGNRR